MDTTTPPQRLREARIKAGFKSAADAARRHGWRTPTYSAHENGTRNLSRENAATYAAAFAVDPAWLLFGDSTRAPSQPVTADGAALILMQMPNGRARLRIDKIVPYALALKVLGMIEEGGE